jgi:hypothetical protein
MLSIYRELHKQNFQVHLHEASTNNDNKASEMIETPNTSSPIALPTNSGYLPSDSLLALLMGTCMLVNTIGQVLRK